jgi:hypothetical protein
MRWVVWMGVVAWTALSCARSESRHGSAGAGAGSGAGGERTSGGRAGDAGALGEMGGLAGRIAAAGTAGSGGRGTAGEAGTAGRSGSSGNGSVGGAGGVAGAQSGTGGTEDGDAGAGGAPDTTCGEYVACGCGCCGSTTPESTQCFYTELGEDLASIVAADEAARSDPACPAAECSLGVRRVCCATPEDPGGATHEVTGTIGGYNRINFKRTGADGRCTRVGFVQPDQGADSFALMLPESWALEGASDYACVDENSAAFDSRRSPIGGVGTLTFTTPQNCAIDFDFTLFFLSESGRVDAVRFVGNGVAVPGGTCSTGQ